MPSSSPPRTLARVLSAGAGLALLTTLAASPALAAPTATGLTLTAPSTAQVGDVIDLTLDLTGAEDVFAYEVTLSHDPTLLTFADAAPASPDGGFDSATGADGTVTVVHTRLGTSPALAGELPVGTVSLTAAAPGTATIMASIELVGADGETLVLTDAATAVVTVTAAPTQEPTTTPPVEPTLEPTEEPTDAPTDTPTDAPTNDPTATDAPTTSDPAASPSSSVGSSGSLASTGAQVGTLVAVAGLAVAVGIFLLRRRSVSAR